MFLQAKIKTRSADNSNIYWSDASDDKYFVFKSRQGQVKLRKRLKYPVTYAVLENNQILRFGYGASDSIDIGNDEFLFCRIDLSTQNFEVSRDMYCTLPLFWSANSEYVSLSDEMGAVLDEASQVTINKKAFAHLIFNPTINQNTLFDNLQLLTSLKELKWQAGKLDIQTKKAINLDNDVSPKDFRTILESVMVDYWQKLVGTSSAFELSGGIDSATMPLFIAKKFGVKGLFGSVQFNGNFRRSQQQKFADIQAATGAKFIMTDIDKKKDYPLARFFDTPFNPKPFYQYQEIYSEGLIKLAQQLKKEGTEAVITGIGGDELFESSTANYRSEPALDRSYFGAAMRDLQNLANVEDSDKTHIANSAFYAGQSRNKIYIDHDIWPISPLSNYYLYTFTQGLAIMYKTNKNILRAYHEANGFPELVYRPVQNEHFGRFFEDSIKENYPKILEVLGSNPVLEKLDLVAWQEFANFFDEARWRENRSSELFEVFRVVSAEVILRSVVKKPIRL